MELGDEVVESDKLDVRGGIALADMIADRAHDVRLPEPGAAVHEERVVDDPRGFRDGARGGDGQAIGRADDEVVEAETRIELHDYLPLLPALSRLSTSSEIDRSVSKTPGP